MNFFYLGLALFDGALALSCVLDRIAAHKGRKRWADIGGSTMNAVFLAVFTTFAIWFGSMVAA